MSYQGPGIYRHYKGGAYEALGRAVREETIGGEEITEIVYRSLASYDREQEFVTREQSDFDGFAYIDRSGNTCKSVCLGDGVISSGSVGGDSPKWCSGCPACRPDNYERKPRFEFVEGRCAISTFAAVARVKRRYPELFGEQVSMDERSLE